MLTVSAHLALLPIFFKIAGISDTFMGGWLVGSGIFRIVHILIESLFSAPWDTVVNPWWDKLVEFIAQDWIAASLHL